MHSGNLCPVLNLLKVTVSLGILLGTLPELVFTPQFSLAKPPTSDRGVFPGRRVGGGSRGECITNAPLVALSPKTNLSKTTTAYPKLYFSLPFSPNSSRFLGFVLKDEQGKTLKRTLFAATQKAGIVELDLAKIVDNPLQVNQNYHWYLSMGCDLQNRSQAVIVDGWISRVEPNSVIASSPSQELSTALVRQYQNAGLWHDALTTLVQLRQSNPENKDVSSLWTGMLKEEGLEQVLTNSFISISNQEKKADNSTN